MKSDVDASKACTRRMHRDPMRHAETRRVGRGPTDRDDARVDGILALDRVEVSTEDGVDDASTVDVRMGGVFRERLRDGRD